MTPEQAEALTTHMADLAKKVDVAEDQARRMRAHTRALWVVVGLLLIGAYALYVVADDAHTAAEGVHDAQVTNCRNANLTRAGQRKAWRELLTVSTASLKAQSAAAGVEPPQAVLDYYAAYIDWIEQDVFPDRDCSDLSKTYREPGPAPSFKEALQAQIDQQKH
jgi:hypothetical protein